MMMMSRSLLLFVVGERVASLSMPLIFGTSVFVSTKWSVSQESIRSCLVSDFGEVSICDYSGGPTRSVARCNAIFFDSKCAHRALRSKKIAGEKACFVLSKPFLRRPTSSPLRRRSLLNFLERQAVAKDSSKARVISALENLEDLEALKSESDFALAVAALATVETDRALALLAESKSRGFLNSTAVAGAAVYAFCETDDDRFVDSYKNEDYVRLDARGYNAAIAHAEAQNDTDLALALLVERRKITHDIIDLARKRNLAQKRTWLQKSINNLVVAPRQQQPETKDTIPTTPHDKTPLSFYHTPKRTSNNNNINDFY